MNCKLPRPPLPYWDDPRLMESDLQYFMGVMSAVISTADKKLQESLCVNFYWKNDIYHFYSKHEKLTTSICLSSLYAFRYSMLSRERLISKVYGSNSSNQRKLKILFLCKCSIYMVFLHILNTIKYIYIFQLLLYLFYSLFLLHSHYYYSTCILVTKQS